MRISPAILCSCTKVKEKHIASFERRDKNYFLRCSQTTSIPDEKQMLWMGNETAHTKPTLPQLMELKIPEEVGEHYRNFGTLLLDDKTGSLVDIAEKSCHYQPDDIVTMILRKWLQEGPTPVTWDNLIQVLRDCGLQTLADYVQDNHGKVILTFNSAEEEMTQLIIDEAMESGSLQQRNVVGVITGPMGTGKTTLLCRLFGEPPPDHYTSTGVAEQPFRGLLHHTLHLSAGAWEWLSHEDIRKLLAPFIKAGMREADVDALASRLLGDVNPTATTSVPTNSLDLDQSFITITASFWYSVKACFCLRRSHPPSSPDRGSLSETAELPETTTAESPTCQELVPLVKSTASAAPTLQNLVLEMVHMIDTGGQPELLQVMPSLVHNADLAIAVHNFEYGLSEQQQVDYHEEGEAYRRKTPFMVSGRDIILKLVSTLHAKKSLDKPFHLLIVATHRDCVEGDLEARVETLNRELCSLLLPAFENELLLFDRPNKIAFVLDLKNPDDSDKGALVLIRREVGKPGLGKTFETPISFFVFEQDLLKFAESMDRRGILSLDECKMVGTQLKMSQEMVVAALVLFLLQNTFLYFHHVLPNHVFIKPQVPLDIINRIFAFSYKELQGVSAKLVSQRKASSRKNCSATTRSPLTSRQESSRSKMPSDSSVTLSP